MDDASKRKLQTHLKGNPESSYQTFFLELTRELSMGPPVSKRNQWRSVKLHLEGGEICFANWRNFRATLEERLLGVEPPSEEGLRDFLL